MTNVHSTGGGWPIHMSKLLVDGDRFVAHLSKADYLAEES